MPSDCPRSACPMECAQHDRPGRLSTADTIPVQLLAGDGRTPIAGCDVRVRTWVQWTFTDAEGKRLPSPEGRSQLSVETYRDGKRVAYALIWCDEVPGLIPPYQKKSVVG